MSVLGIFRQKLKYEILINIKISELNVAQYTFMLHKGMKPYFCTLEIFFWKFIQMSSLMNTDWIFKSYSEYSPWEKSMRKELRRFILLFDFWCQPVLFIPLQVFSLATRVHWKTCKNCCSAEKNELNFNMRLLTSTH